MPNIQDVINNMTNEPMRVTSPVTQIAAVIPEPGRFPVDFPDLMPLLTTEIDLSPEQRYLTRDHDTGELRTHPYQIWTRRGHRINRVTGLQSDWYCAECLLRLNASSIQYRVVHMPCCGEECAEALSHRIYARDTYNTLVSAAYIPLLPAGSSGFLFGLTDPYLEGLTVNGTREHVMVSVDFQGKHFTLELLQVGNFRHLDTEGNLVEIRQQGVGHTSHRLVQTIQTMMELDTTATEFDPIRICNNEYVMILVPATRRKQAP